MDTRACLLHLPHVEKQCGLLHVKKIMHKLNMHRQLHPSCSAGSRDNTL